MKTNFLKIVTLVIGLHSAAGTATAMSDAQALTALLIAPTSWAALIAQEKGASPKVTNGLLILADINRLLHDVLMLSGEQGQGGRQNPALPYSSAWLASTSSTNLLLLAEHIQAFKSATSNPAQDHATPLNESYSVMRKNNGTDTLITIGKIILPLAESLFAYGATEELHIQHYYRGYSPNLTFVKFLKSLAQHSNQLLSSKPDSVIRKAAIAALVADYSIFITAELKIEQERSRRLLEETINELRPEYNFQDNAQPQIRELQQRLNNRNQQIQQLQQQVNQLHAQQSADQAQREAQTQTPRQEADPCCICFEPYNQTSHDKQKITLTCGHDLCRECNNTLARSTIARHNDCPVCRERYCIHLQ